LPGLLSASSFDSKKYPGPWELKGEIDCVTELYHAHVPLPFPGPIGFALHSTGDVVANADRSHPGPNEYSIPCNQFKLDWLKPLIVKQI
jgi:hypothetical protein